MQNVVVVGCLIVIATVLGAIDLVNLWRSEPQPRVLVLDTRVLIESIASDPALDEAGRARRTQEVAAAANRLIDRHIAEGAVVLDAKAVIRAPYSAYVRP